jgi:hypothetical protein
MSPVGPRLVNLLSAVAVGALFVAGLFVHGPVGALLLLATDVILIMLSAATWPRIRPQGRPLRVAVIAVIAGVAVAKLAAS